MKKEQQSVMAWTTLKSPTSPSMSFLLPAMMVLKNKLDYVDSHIDEIQKLYLYIFKLT